MTSRQELKIKTLEAQGWLHINSTRVSEVLRRTSHGKTEFALVYNNTGAVRYQR